MNSVGRNPILLIILNYLAGWAITQGYLDPGSKSDFVEAAADVFGMGLVFITSLYSLFHVFKNQQHEHKVTEPTSPVEKVTVREITTTSEQAPQQPPVRQIEQNGGTPDTL